MPKKKKTPEEIVKEEVCQWLTDNKYFFWITYNGAVYDRKSKSYRKPSRWHRRGVCDILGITKDGRPLGIELKAPESYRVSKEQKEFISIFNELGGLAFVAKSVDDVKKRLLT